MKDRAAFSYRFPPENTPQIMMASTDLRILCLGASLVAGYSCMGAVYHPFSHSLVTMLGRTMPQVKVEIDVDGVPGDRVTTGTFVERIKKHGESLRAAMGVIRALSVDTGG